MPASILATIVRAKHVEVEAAKVAVAPDVLAAQAEAMPQQGPAAPRGLRAALQRPPGAPVRVLAEIKRASPSAGPIRAGADPAIIARAYADAGAAAISVLTDRAFFAGDLAFLPIVRAAVGLPLLRKDFVVDPYQVDEARVHGADGVLLIAAVLAPAALAACVARAHALGLDALVEVHAEAEVEAALGAGADLIGVNHRDLGTFALDMSLTGLIAPRLPDDVVLVAESGIKVAADLTLLGSQGAHAVLVGEALMRAADPGQALRALRGGR